jgi:hypothetical protein
MPRLRPTAIAIATAGCMAAAFSATTTASASAQTGAPAQTGASPQTQYCNDPMNFPTISFWRCTGATEGSPWVGSSCNVNNYNAGTSYNVYAWDNACGDRVWLHQYTYPKDVDKGWSYCISPGSIGVTPTQYRNPQNIEVVSNTAKC